MAFPFIIAAQALTGVIGIISNDMAAKKARSEKIKAQRKLASLERNRQDIVNPYENVTDLSSMITNPMANLGVATKAAEMQVEQADISLANTLDTIRATGASAGGATALAQAALQSKKGVSASIEQQEAQNEKLRAQGEQALNQQKMAEARRIQGAEAAGKEFMFSQQENREIMALDRAQNQADNAAAQEAQSRADMMAALTGTISGIASTAGSAYEAGAFDKTDKTDKTDNLDIKVDQKDTSLPSSKRKDGIPQEIVATGGNNYSYSAMNTKPVVRLGENG